SATVLRDGDRLQFGTTIVRFALHDEVDEAHHRSLYEAAGIPFSANEAPTSSRQQRPWSPESWVSKPNAQAIPYAEPAAYESVVNRLRKLPPLVTSWE